MCVTRRAHHPHSCPVVFYIPDSANSAVGSFHAIATPHIAFPYFIRYEKQLIYLANL